jgi:hypothetical protein
MPTHLFSLIFVIVAVLPKEAAQMASFFQSGKYQKNMRVLSVYSTYN